MHPDFTDGEGKEGDTQGLCMMVLREAELVTMFSFFSGAAFA